MRSIVATAIMTSATSALILASANLASCNRQPSDTTSTTSPTNTGTNTRDRGGATMTPADQGQGQADVRITADVRKAIMDDSSMSMNAQNCKIIASNGVVTLRGPVNSQAEKDSIEAKAKAVAGVASVDNQLEIKAP